MRHKLLKTILAALLTLAPALWSCTIRDKAEDPFDEIPAVNTDSLVASARAQGMQEERQKWQRWVVGCSNRCEHIITEATPRVLRSNDCCEKGLIIGQEFKEVLDLFTTYPQK